MLVNVGRMPIDARFDPSIAVSRIPQSLLSVLMGSTVATSTGSILLPLTVCYDHSTTFTTRLSFAIVGTPLVILGMDWFSVFRDHIIETEHHPPSSAGFDIATFQPLPLRDVSDGIPSAELNVTCNTVNVVSAIEPVVPILRPASSSPIAGPSVASSSEYVFPRINVLIDTLLESDSAAFAMSTFDDTVLSRTLTDHGIIATGSMLDKQHLLCHHIVSGLCALHRTSTCRLLAGSGTVSELRSALLQSIIAGHTSHRYSDVLLIILCAALGHQIGKTLTDKRIYEALMSLQSLVPTSVYQFVSQYDELTKPHLLVIAARHGLCVCGTSKTIKEVIMDHLTHGVCLVDDVHLPSSCSDLRNEAPDHGCPQNRDDMQAYIFSTLAPRLALKPLKHLLDTHRVSYRSSDGLAKLRKLLQRHAHTLVKGKVRCLEAMNMSMHDQAALQSIRKQWPSPIASDLKSKISALFRERTSSDALRSGTCACCGESTLLLDLKMVPCRALDLSILRYPGCPIPQTPQLDDGNLSDCENPVNFSSGVEARTDDDGDVIGEGTQLNSERRTYPYVEDDHDDTLDRTDTDDLIPEYGGTIFDPSCLPFTSGPFKDLLLDPGGITTDPDGVSCLKLCKGCSLPLARKKLPRLALANRMYLGPVPDVLKDLTPIEESMIALCRAKMWIVQLKEDNDTYVSPNTQRGLRGHSIIYPQDPGPIATLLPPSIEDIVTPVTVIFVGSEKPSQEWLKEKAKPLTVRADRVRAALIWLKQHNPLYRHIVINEGVLCQINATSFLPYHVEHVLPSVAQSVLQSRYDNNAACPQQDARPDDEVAFQNVVITDVDGHASCNELRAAAIRHVKAGGGYIQVPHHYNPVNEFQNAALFPMMYPTLFPYGLGGLEDQRRNVRVSLRAHIKHLFSLSDERFQRHHSFMFVAFNMLQRRSLLLHTSLKVKKANFATVASRFAHVSLQAVETVTERVKRGDTVTARDDEERQVLQLMKEVNVITAHVQGSAAAKVSMRNEMRGLMMHMGLPSFFITLNPADVYNPVVKFLAGSDIDVDSLQEEDVPQYWEQSLLVARNPIIAAKFFHLYMKTFISTLLGFDPKDKNLEGGVLGITKGYYGVVEAQGRGTLHCHMLVWLEGALNPNEIRDRVLRDHSQDFQKNLILYLDDAISNHVPDAPFPLRNVPSSEFRPSALRGLNGLTPSTPEDELADLHNLVTECQVHKHTHTCYKRNIGKSDQCRFDLDASNYNPITSIDQETGVLTLRCLDGLVNNFNETILKTMRCNMDIKFIGSGTCAKAVLYYITNYISKSELKTHVAFAALELAVSKLGEDHVEDDLKTLKAKKLLQKCAHAMISHQELSAPQVCSYLLGFGDNYTSHIYRKFYWTTFETYINTELPSPECYRTQEEARPESDVLEDGRRTPITLNDALDEDNLVHDAGEDGEVEDMDVDEPENGEDVGIDLDDDGGLIRKSSLVADYVNRGTLFQHLSLWDFVTQIDKVRHRVRKNGTDGMENDLPEDEHEGASDIQLNNTHVDAMTIDASHANPLKLARELLGDVNKIRPKENLQTGHDNNEIYVHVLRHPKNRYVVVPIGPAMPRRDLPHSKARYQRLMLILFHPWRAAKDLRHHDESWDAAFQRILHKDVAEPRALQIMDNMQILHECKDARDEHYANRLGRRNNFKVSPELSGSRNAVDDFMTECPDDEDILTHLDSITDTFSVRAQTNAQVTMDCVISAQVGGLFEQGGRNPIVPTMQNTITKVPETDNEREQTWRQAYDSRRDAVKKKNRLQVPPSTIANHRRPLIAGIEMNNVAQCSRDPIVPLIVPASVVSEATKPVDLNDVIERFTLNHEQALAFRIVADHSNKNLVGSGAEPLRMFLGGSAGTGKSQVLNALRYYFEQRQQCRRLRICSFMGVAARHVNGMTLHAALCMGKPKQGKKAEKTYTEELMSLWEGVDFLFVDEVSMISCKFLYRISQALSTAKGNSSVFGGMNIIFAGDFAQLPPVRAKRLYAKLRTRGDKCASHDDILGKLLWLSVKTVVVLDTQHRQTGPENARFVQLLQRLREGRCNEEDIELLHSRIMSPANFDRTTKEWVDAPVIVTSNAAKDALNERAAKQFARETDQELHWYHATDYHGQGKNPVKDRCVVDRLRAMDSGKTQYRLGKLPLVIGMPVLVSQNFDVDGGVVNGSRGTVTSIRYTVDSEGDRHLKSCVVNLPEADPNPMPDLPKQEFPILADTTRIEIFHPYTGAKRVFFRTQVPLVPAFAMTAHRAQGQTLEHVIIDLQSCTGTEAPYVMASRAKSLQGLIILRPFDAKRVQVSLSEDARSEKKRIETLRLRTLITFGDANETQHAAEQLLQLGSSPTLDSDGMSAYPERGEDPQRLLCRLQDNVPPPPRIPGPPRIMKRTHLNLSMTDADREELQTISSTARIQGPLRITKRKRLTKDVGRPGSTLLIPTGIQSSDSNASAVPSSSPDDSLPPVVPLTQTMSAPRIHKIRHCTINSEPSLLRHSSKRNFDDTPFALYTDKIKRARYLA